MPRLEGRSKTNPCFPKDYEDIVGHIITEVNFFTPSEPRGHQQTNKQEAPAASAPGAGSQSNFNAGAQHIALASLESAELWPRQ
jgi:hypothetical protein